MIENPALKNKGAKWWHTDDYHSPNLSKKSMGEFFHHVLKVGAQIGEVWCFDKNFDRSIVLVTLFMTDEMKEELETKFKYRFRTPPKIVLN